MRTTDQINIKLNNQNVLTSLNLVAVRNFFVKIPHLLTPLIIYANAIIGFIFTQTVYNKLSEEKFLKKKKIIICISNDD